MIGLFESCFALYCNVYSCHSSSVALILLLYRLFSYLGLLFCLEAFKKWAKIKKGIFCLELELYYCLFVLLFFSDLNDKTHGMANAMYRCLS